MTEVEIDPSQLLADRNRRGETASSFNKSMDFARHTAKGKGALNFHNSTDTGLFGESFATMGESFLGESFANIGEASFAPTGGFMDDGDFSYSDSNDGGDEAWLATKTVGKVDLETVIDIEEDEEESEIAENETKA